MSRISDISDRALEQALELVHTAGNSLRNAGYSLKDAGSNAGHLLQTGAALGAVKTGTRVATKFARRNPAVLVAAAAGVGLIAYASYRKRKQSEEATAIDGSAERLGRSNSVQRARAAGIITEPTGTFSKETGPI